MTAVVSPVRLKAELSHQGHQCQKQCAQTVNEVTNLEEVFLSTQHQVKFDWLLSSKTILLSLDPECFLCFQNHFGMCTRLKNQDPKSTF